jgi:microcystin-dependent protein
MSFNPVITNIKAEKKTINQIPNTNTLIMDSNYVEFSGNLIVNGDSIINGNTTISNELFIEGNSNVIINNYDVSENSVQQTVYNPYIPFGAVVSFATKKAPDGWLACDGSYVLKADYKNLFDVIGNIWDISGDNNDSKFRLPNLNSAGYFIQGGNVDGQYYIDSTSKPKNNFTITVDSNTVTDDAGYHEHYLYTKEDDGNSHGQSWYMQGYWRGLPNAATRTNLKGLEAAGNHNHTFSANITSDKISPWDNETAPINIKFLYCIKY